MRTILAFLWQLRRGVVAMCLLYFGGYQLYLGTAFHTQRTMSYADFARALPSIGWYRITGVTLDRTHSVVRTTTRGDDGEYVPAVDPSGRIFLLVAGHDDGRTNVDVDGTIEYGTDIEPSQDRDLRPLRERLAPNFRVIDENQKPALALGLVLGSIGVIVGLLVGLSAIGSALQPRKPLGRPAATEVRGLPYPPKSSPNE